MQINNMCEIEEIWKPIKGYEGFYEVSNKGNVKSINRICRANVNGKRIIKERLLSLCKSKNGYFTVILTKNNQHKSFSVHRLVSATFLPNTTNKKEVNHKDENKTNNDVSNLEWCDRKYNANYGTGKFRCVAQQVKPVSMLDLEGNEIKSFLSQKQASNETGICNRSISRVCRGKGKVAGGYRWKFKEKDYGN